MKIHAYFIVLMCLPHEWSAQNILDGNGLNSKSKSTCTDRNVDILFNEIQILKREVNELKYRVKYLETNQVIKEDCYGWYKFGKHENGVYRISPDGEYAFEVFCDMQNGGWTVIQQRVDGSVTFDRLWTDYKHGFGNVSRDHWLGLGYIHLLAEKPVQIAFELLMSVTGNLATAVYDGFQVENESSNFTMHVSPNVSYNTEMQNYISPANGFYYHNEMQFSTKDRDNDKCGCNCAYDPLTKRGGYWYNNCYEFGGVNNDFNHMDIYDGLSRPVSRVKIKLKKQN